MGTPVRSRVRATMSRFATVLAIVVILVASVGCIRWARGHSAGRQFVASAMMLVLGMVGPAVKAPQQGIEEAREDKGKKGSESGDPPAT
jgi:hypothetical protein